MSRAVMSWTGGKDSSLAYYEAEKLGYKIDYLVTFVWDHDPLLAHPLPFINLQSQALDVPHLVVEVSEPFASDYERAIALLKEQRGIGTIITGDICEVAGHNSNWMVDRAAPSSVEVIRPLWHRDRIQILNKILELGFKVVFSCVKKPWFTEDWLGKELSRDMITRLVEMNERSGIDICGEQGEYHTLVLNGPQFKKGIQIEYSTCAENSLLYLALEKLTLEERKA